MRLNLGCGGRTPEGWVNVDWALGARFAKVPFFRVANRKLGIFRLHWDEDVVLHDLNKAFPWADDSVDAIYSSHLLEHFAREDGLRLLGECHRVLKPGGIIRLVVPDLRHHVAEYRDGRVPADEFVEKLGVLYAGSGPAWKRRLSPLVQFPHKCMYDQPRLVAIMRARGFEATSRNPFDSTINDIEAIESEGRTRHAVIVEGHKVASAGA